MDINPQRSLIAQVHLHGRSESRGARPAILWIRIENQESTLNATFYLASIKQEKLKIWPFKFN